MDILVDNKAAIDEETWRAWVRKGKLREQAAARKWKRLGGIALIILAVGIVLYLYAV